MDGASTLVLEGSANTLPSLNVSDSATVDGKLLLRISLPPMFSSYGVWQNFTIMTCSQECRGTFQALKVETNGDCASVADYREVRERESLIAVAVSFAKLPVCLAPAFLPPLMLCVMIMLFFNVQ